MAANCVAVIYVLGMEPINLKIKEYKIKNNYTGAENLDFKSDDAAKKINNYVKSATGSKIKNIVSKSSLKNATALLVNSMSFTGVWEKIFGGFHTYENSFYKDGERVQRNFLHAYHAYQTYAWDYRFSVVILNYKNPEYRFAIFYPRQKYGLKKVLEKMDAARFQKLLGAAKRRLVNTYIPKIDVKTKVLLKDILPKLGITDLFDGSADLSEIADELKITNGVHKARIQINEEGTVAAPKFSSVRIPNEESDEDPVDYYTKCPFLFALVRENHPVLMGVYHG
uniref:SERPIN domain-containing protein n=1 Tax=Caenorhabditis japonica TaxID=281687 RepID=A0A8R1DH85_CAEJA